MSSCTLSQVQSVLPLEKRPPRFAIKFLSFPSHHRRNQIIIIDIAVRFTLNRMPTTTTTTTTPSVEYYCPCLAASPHPPPPHLPSSSYSFHPLHNLFFCEECDAIRCNRCVLLEVSGYYCPNCLFEVPSASVRAEKNRYAHPSPPPAPAPHPSPPCCSLFIYLTAYKRARRVPHADARATASCAPTAATR